ncbi:ABC transporter substrate-binding protein [Acrocarpospora catenulata]|uniref:ABC transporter substrate-binding protein n=1 Tax=Acrocarpospora catenulata TaxID=2836182 RepID=UPI001BDA5B95|nr:extracellular solute-binding protein [Acrocarpospora catenulata]
MKRSWTGAAAVVLALSLVAGCGGDDGATTSAPAAPSAGADWATVVEAAKKEGHVTWYSVAPSSAREALKAAFEAKYPEITVEIRTISTAEMNSALEAERGSGAQGGDVVTSVGYDWIFDKAKQGWFADFIGPSFEAPEWTESGYLIDGRIVAAPLGLLVLGWNTSLFQDKITTYDDLLDPRLGNGAIGVVKPEPALHADHWAFVEENFNKDYVKALAAQKPKVYPSASALQEALAAGEVAVGSFVSATDMIALKEKGAPVDYAVPSPVWAAQNMFFIVKSAHHPNAAQLFMDFFVSPEGQLAAAKNGSSPLKSVAPQTLGGDSKIVFTNLDRALDAKWAGEYAAKWHELYGS